MATFFESTSSCSNAWKACILKVAPLRISETRTADTIHITYNRFGGRESEFGGQKPTSLNVRDSEIRNARLTARSGLNWRSSLNVRDSEIWNERPADRSIRLELAVFGDLERTPLDQARIGGLP